MAWFFLAVFIVAIGGAFIVAPRAMGGAFARGVIAVRELAEDFAARRVVGKPAGAPPPPSSTLAARNWRGALLIGAAVAVAFVVLLAVADALDGGLFRPSGREIAADARANEAAAQADTRQAEIEMGHRAIVRIEERGERLEFIERERERANETIEAAGDGDARHAAYSDFAQRMRDEAARSRAAAVQDYRASVDP